MNNNMGSDITTALDFYKKIILNICMHKVAFNWNGNFSHMRSTQSGTTELPFKIACNTYTTFLKCILCIAVLNIKNISKDVVA